MAYGRNGGYAQIEIPKGIFDQFAAEHQAVANGFKTDFRYSSTISLPIRVFDIPQLQTLQRLFAASGPEHRAAARNLIGYLDITLDSDGRPIKNLKQAEVAFLTWLRRDYIRGWVFNTETEFPYLVIDVTYAEATRSGDDYSPAEVRVSMSSWGCGMSNGGGFTVYTEDIRGRTVAQVFLDHGYIHEDAGLHRSFDAVTRTYLSYRDKLGLQFLCNDGARVVNDTAADGSEDDEGSGGGWGRRRKRGTRVVKTREFSAVRPRDAGTIAAEGPSNDDGEDDNGEDAEQIDAKGRALSQVPIHPWLYCFDLKAHEFGWYPTTEMAPYQYNPGLRELLILPVDHGQLIDALVSDLEIVAEDIIEGKSGGTTILCQGRPGTGKTLTAEVYSEAVSRPLYRVHSGQLGITPDSVEQVLVMALGRAERWGAILLIDEADVFLMQRGNDLERNAVVGVFLRVLEYFKGILFLTTNRLDAIDDAIVSRCIAVIKYANPGVEERRKIWETQLRLLSVTVDNAMISSMAQHWDCSGRDIKGLVRLTSRYCRAHDRVPMFDDFKRMAAFRGL